MTDGAPIVEGDKVTYTLSYTLANGPVTDGVITDVLPDGLTYVAGTATDNDEFAFQSYDAACLVEVVGLGPKRDLGIDCPIGLHSDSPWPPGGLAAPVWIDGGFGSGI